MTLDEMKSTSDAYEKIPTGEFAFRVWNSEKEDESKETLPMGVWADEHGVNNKDFKDMVEFSSSTGYNPTDRVINNEHIPENAQGRAIFQGMTFGFGDEIVGGVAALTDAVISDEEMSTDSMMSKYKQFRDSERQQIKDFRTNAAGEALAYEVAGSLASPAMLLNAPKAINAMSAGKKAMTVSGTYGAAYGAGASEEETMGGIAKDAATTGITSSLFGLGIQHAVPIVGNIGKNIAGKASPLVSKAGKAGQRLAEKMKRNEKVPTIEGLRNAKNDAYSIVSKSKARFGVEDLQELRTAARKIAVNNHHNEFKDKSTQGALNMINKLSSKGEDLTLVQLDKVRQQLGVRFKQSPDQIALREMMDAVDSLIQKKASVFPEMATARVANIKYKKAEKLDHYFNNAKTDLDLKKSGATQVYKTAVASLLKNKKDIRWFSEEERMIMEQFVKGGKIDNAIARVGNIAPGSGKLMAALGFYGFYVSPMILIPAGISMVAKKFADKNIKNKAVQIINTMGSIKKAPVRAVPGMQQAGGASGAIQQK